jgi:hypothetical protein
LEGSAERVSIAAFLAHEGRNSNVGIACSTSTAIFQDLFSRFSNTG